MFKKIYQITIFFILSSAVAVFQFSFVNVLPGIWSQINLVLIVAIFTLFFFDWRAALFYTAVSGFWLDLLSFEFFGLYLASLFLTIIISNLILKNFLTNRSFYSFFTLITTATIIYNIFLAGFLFLSFDGDGRSLFANGSFYLALVYQIIWSLFLALALFNLVTVLTKSFRPFFLVKK